MPIRQAQNARKRKTVLESGEAEAQAIAAQRDERRITRAQKEGEPENYSMSDPDAPLLGRLNTMSRRSMDRKEAARLGISIADLRAQRAAELVDPEGVQRPDRPGNPRGTVPEGGEASPLGDEERRRRRGRVPLRTVLSETVGGTRLGA